MEQTNVTQNQMINEILRIGHGKLSIYTDVGLRAVKDEPELFGHLIAWNAKKGEIRDSKTALPVIAFRGETDTELFENAAAHLCQLDPKNLVRALRYNKELPTTNGGKRWLDKAVELYVKKREQKPSWWDRTALQHRKNLKTLYAMNHIKPSARADRILFKRQFPEKSVFAKVKQLKDMKPVEAAGTILNYRIPFLVAVGALGGIKDKTDVILALIERMSAAELINNTASLKRWGVMENDVLKAAYDKALSKPVKKVSTLKAGKAAEAVGDKKLSKKLKKVQEEQIDKRGGIDGDWLVLGDRSGSMQNAIEVARQVAAILARQVKGQVHLVFFNTSPTYLNVTGKTLDQIQDETRRFSVSGMTSVGCGLEILYDKNILVNGIAIASDGGDNHRPLFHDSYKKYCAKMGIDPTVYLYHVPGADNSLIKYCNHAGIMVECFELGYDVDYYSLPQLAFTMRTSRYSLAEEIMETKLLTFSDVFKEAI